MKCEKCSLWLKRKLPKEDRKFYPAGRCLALQFNKNNARMFTTKDTNCNIGELK